MTTSAAYDQMVRVCYGLPAMTYRLSEGARVQFREFQAWYQRRMVDERLLRSSETFHTALGKIEGLCGRVALVWHLIEAPYTIEVSGGLMARVIQFVKISLRSVITSASVTGGVTLIVATARSSEK